MAKLEWYGLQTVYIHRNHQHGHDNLYEERIVLVRAASFDEAIVKAESEANDYSTDGTEYLGYAMAFHMYDRPADLTEVFSLCRDSRMKPKAYIDRFFDTGRERSKDLS